MEYPKTIEPGNASLKIYLPPTCRHLSVAWYFDRSSPILISSLCVWAHSFSSYSQNFFSKPPKGPVTASTTGLESDDFGWAIDLLKLHAQIAFITVTSLLKSGFHIFGEISP